MCSLANLLEVLWVREHLPGFLRELHPSHLCHCAQIVLLVWHRPDGREIQGLRKLVLAWRQLGRLSAGCRQLSFLIQQARQSLLDKLKLAEVHWKLVVVSNLCLACELRVKCLHILDVLLCEGGTHVHNLPHLKQLCHGHDSRMGDETKLLLNAEDRDGARNLNLGEAGEAAHQNHTCKLWMPVWLKRSGPKAGLRVIIGVVGQACNTRLTS
mmetsp:Transcript_67547/g.162163  ORF Transcript_67547/g.162163 Transcript_67547/m.162163 type:complete len:212 (-) Transcript_67547:24-659(-)